MANKKIKDVISVGISSLIDSNIIDEFDCGNKDINNYLKKQAINDEKSNYTITTCYIDKDVVPNRMLGFYTLSTGNLEIPMHPSDKLTSPKGKELKQFPVINLYFFAIAKNYQNQRMGKAMMYHLFYDMIYYVSFKGHLSFQCIYLQAVNEATDFYESLGFGSLNSYIDESNQYSKYVKMMINVDSIIEKLKLSGIKTL